MVLGVMTVSGSVDGVGGDGGQWECCTLDILICL